MEIIRTPLEGLVVVQPKFFRDDRGWFVESYNRSRFKEIGIDLDFVQDNHSRSVFNTLRGLHFQSRPGQAKLIRCTLGKIWDVAVDIRPSSATFGQHYAVELSAENMTECFIPVGFAHGFYVLSQEAEVQYKCSHFYDAATEAGLAWDDPELQVPWPLQDGLKPRLSKRDVTNPSFMEYRQKTGG